jgi:hypothetical protein
LAIKNTIWLKKIAASFLLLLLFATTAVKILHFHSSNTVSARKAQLEKTSFSHYAESVADTKCFICDYELTKDADASHSISYIIYLAEFNSAITKSYAFTLQSINAVFETRGPPST